MFIILGELQVAQLTIESGIIAVEQGKPLTLRGIGIKKNLPKEVGFLNCLSQIPKA